MAISADGGEVLYHSYSTNLVAGISDLNSDEDVYVFDRGSGTSALVSRALGSAVVTADDGATPVALSANGDHVLFESFSTNLISGLDDFNGLSDVFVFDRVTEDTALVSRSMESPLQSASRGGLAIAISADGNQVLFDSYSDDLVVLEEDPNGLDLDVFLFDRLRHQVALVSRSREADWQPANWYSSSVALSSGGDVVLMQSKASDLVRGLFDSLYGSQEVFVAEIDLGAIFVDGLE